MIATKTPETLDQHERYEDKLLSSAKIVLATLEELTSPLLVATSTADDGTLNYFHPSSYKERLGTFRTPTFFAKPTSLSPIVCARFGWINTEKDIIRCSHPACNAVICLDINPNLSEIASQFLIQKYLEMLATSHIDDGRCPFRSDAERWLLIPKGEARDKLCEGFVVPPYLLPLSNEYHLFEYAHKSLLINALGKEAAKISKALNRTTENNTKETFAIALPKIVSETIQERYPNDETFISALTHSLQNYDEVEEDDSSHPEITADCSLLACFGWRLDTSDFSDSLPRGTRVKCELCNSCAVLSFVEDEEKIVYKRAHNNESNKDYVTNNNQEEKLNEFNRSSKPTKTEEESPTNSFTNQSLSAEPEIVDELKKRKRIYAIKYHYDFPDSSTGTAKTQQTISTNTKYYKRPSPCKRRRTMNKDEEQKYFKADISEEIALSKMSFHSDFDVINSHRHFCPYQCGFQSEIDLEKANKESEPGWKIIISKILKTLNQSADERSITDEKNYLGFA